MHKQKMSAPEGREDGSPLPFQRVLWEQGKGAAGWWLSLQCREPHHPLCVKAKPSMGMRSLCHEVPVSESYWTLSFLSPALGTVSRPPAPVPGIRAKKADHEGAGRGSRALGKEQSHQVRGTRGDIPSCSLLWGFWGLVAGLCCCSCPPVNALLPCSL